MLHVYWNPLCHFTLYWRYAAMHIILWTKFNNYVYKFSKQILFLLFLLYALLKHIIIILNCCIPIIFIAPVLFLPIIRLLFTILIVAFHVNVSRDIFLLLLFFFALFSQQMSFSQSVYHFYLKISLMFNHKSDFWTGGGAIFPSVRGTPPSLYYFLFLYIEFYCAANYI